MQWLLALFSHKESLGTKVSGCSGSSDDYSPKGAHDPPKECVHPNAKFMQNVFHIWTVYLLKMP